MYQPIRGQSGNRSYPFDPKITNVVEDFEMWLLTKFR